MQSECGAQSEFAQNDQAGDDECFQEEDTIFYADADKVGQLMKGLYD
jgi:hypothetical protein